MLLRTFATVLGALSLLPSALADTGIDSTNYEKIIESTVQMRTHSLHAPYVDQDLQNRWFSFGGDAYVNTNKHIRLTQDRSSETGWLWSRLPLTTINFQIEVEFKISSASAHLYGDGMAVWLTSRRAVSGPVFGFENNFEGIGIFIDTFANHNHRFSFPRISAMVGDGKTAYDGGMDGIEQEVGSCSANVRDLDIATKLRITYLRGRFLDVKVQYKAWDEWTPCFTIENPKIPQNPFLGFSALTGEVSESHDIVSVATNSIILNPGLAGLDPNSKKGGRKSFFGFGGGSGTPSKSKSGSNHPTKSGGGFLSTLFWWIVKLALAAGVLYGGLQGYKMYTTNTRGGQKPMPWDSKRF